MTKPRIQLNSGWYIEYPLGFEVGDPREGEFWLYDNTGVGKMIVGFDEHDALEFALAMNPRLNNKQAINPIERDEDMQRDYIPLHGGYEFQTHGKGSTVRLLLPNGDRVPFNWEPPHVQRALENCMRAQHHALVDLHNENDALREYYEAREVQDKVPNTGISVDIRNAAGIRVDRARADLAAVKANNND